MNPDFRTVARALRAHINDPYSLLDAADSVVALLPEPTVVIVPSHALLVAAARGNADVMNAVHNKKKIEAIKHLRGLFGSHYCGLKAAKEAVEDSSVWYW